MFLIHEWFERRVQMFFIRVKQQKIESFSIIFLVFLANMLFCFLGFLGHQNLVFLQEIL